MRSAQTRPEIIAKIKNKLSSSPYTVLAGLSKNAGKTSLLNWLLENSNFANPAVITTGRDGENIDLVGGHSKPKVALPAHSFFTSFSSTLAQQAPFLKVIGPTPFTAINKQLWLAQTLFPLKTEVVGPATVSQQIALADYILENGADHIYIDGSLDRRSIATNAKIQEIFLVAGAQFGNIKDIINEIEKLELLTSIPKLEKDDFSSEICYWQAGKMVKSDFKSIYGHEGEICNWNKAEFIYFPGALTDISFNKMKKFFTHFSGKLIFQHPFYLQLNHQNLSLLKKQARLYCVSSIKIAAVAVNSFAPNGRHVDCLQLRKKLKLAFPQLFIFDIKEVKYG